MSGPHDVSMGQPPSFSEAEQAIASGAVFECHDDKLLQKYLRALCWSKVSNEDIRHRVIIEGITLAQLLMRNFVARVDRQNRFLSGVVIVLAIISILSQLLPWIFPRDVSHSSGQATSHYELKDVEETAHNGKPIRNLYKIDVATGHVWRLEASPLVSSNLKDVLTWADGWEPIQESTDAALKLAKKNLDDARKWQAPLPQSSPSPQ